MRIRDDRGRLIDTVRDSHSATPEARAAVQRRLRQHNIRPPRAAHLIAVYVPLVIIVGLIMIGFGYSGRYAEFVAIPLILAFIIAVS
ncbi:MAG: hypothetical protein JSV91_06935 [Phycisphaerales bacterium]|nr:MAG: hypothetical protein JSV91_06935 [Phycisphaerales bacterium]